MLRICANRKQGRRGHEPTTLSRERPVTKGETSVKYRVNDPQVISETVGGETIVVNLATGHYFNLQGTAVDVWEAILREEPRDTIVAGLTARYAAANGEIADAVDSLLAELAAAELVVPEESNEPAHVPESTPQAGQDLAPFTPPSFTAFTDMQDIILLDPVHEVDARGWPHAPANA
jgi:hypothetical protein